MVNPNAAEIRQEAGYAGAVASRIFVSYARSDEKTASALVDHLRQLETGGLAEVWFDRRLELGESWEQRIEGEVARADVVLLLIGPAYLASTFISRRELPLIAERGKGGALVIPVVLAPCTWRDHQYIGTLQAFEQGRELKAPTTITFGRQAAELVEQLRRLIATGHAPSPAATAPPREDEGAPLAAHPASTGRIDAAGIAFKGSQLQTQIYVNARPQTLDAAVREKLGLCEQHQIQWCSPVAARRFAEYSDRSFLEAVGCGHLLTELKQFWPRGGPRWDALGKVSLPDGRSGVLLAEGKSYPEEMMGGGAKASPASRAQIAEAMAATQRALQLPQDPERWLGRYYQFANRLAHMIWLRSQGIESWLVHLCFLADPHGPTDEATWRAAIAAMHKELGISAPHLDHVGEVFLPALERESLLAGD